MHMIKQCKFSKNCIQYFPNYEEIHKDSRRVIHRTICSLTSDSEVQHRLAHTTVTNYKKILIITSDY